MYTHMYIYICIHVCADMYMWLYRDTITYMPSHPAQPLRKTSPQTIFCNITRLPCSHAGFSQRFADIASWPACRHGLYARMRVF